MPAQLENVSAGAGGGSSQLAWNHTIGNLGSSGLIIVAGMGRESNGEQNPEHIDAITFNGVSMTLVADGGSNETAGEMYELHGSQVPVAGTYEVRIFYSGSGTPNVSRGICASFRKVYNQVKEAFNTLSTNQGGSKSLSITPLTPNALVVASHWWRVGFAENPVGNGFLTAAINRGDNSAGISMYYKTVLIPALTTFTVDAGNTEDQGINMGAFRTTKQGGGFLAHFM